MSEKQVFTTKEAAEFLSIDHRTLDNWRFLNKGPRYVKYSRRMIRYRLADLLEWQNASIVDPQNN